MGTKKRNPVQLGDPVAVDRMYTIPELATVTNEHANRLRRAVHEGALRARRVNSRRYVVRGGDYIAWREAQVTDLVAPVEIDEPEGAMEWAMQRISGIPTTRPATDEGDAA